VLTGLRVGQLIHFKETVMARRNGIKVAALLIACVIGGRASAYYDAFPSAEGPYVSGPASTTLPWSGENFESYTNGAVIETSTNKSAQPHLDVTSGTLESKYAGTWRRGWTDDYNFRAVAIGRDAQGREIKWTDQVAEYRGYIDAWQTSAPDWAGLHLFARYRTSDDLYVSSIRRDGLATIKRKWNGSYTTLAQTTLPGSYLDGNGVLLTDQWYRLRFSAIGSNLELSLDGTSLLTATSGTFSWGTTGMRIDYADTYIDDWKLIYSGGGAPEPGSATVLATLAIIGSIRRRGRSA
jgi:hypothetical protein